MRALVWNGTDLRVTDHPEPRANAGTAVVRVALAGICNTDLEIVKGYMGFRGVLGHELVGTVEEGPAQWKGKRVVGEINFACGVCAVCRNGLGRHCARRSVMGILNADGAFAELIAVPLANLREVPDGVSEEDAVFTEPLAAAFEILEQIPMLPGTRTIVLGDGKLGLLVAQVLSLAGAEVLAVGRHAAKLAILERRGIETVHADQWRREPADLVVEATGTAAGFAAAVAATRPRGTLVLKSTVAGRPEVDLAPLVINEISVIGSRCGRFEPALRALADGSIDVHSLISARRPLGGAVEAFEEARRAGVLKVLVEPERRR
jgi:threonine dehydrogenase-like Zn-dependent dehydrogenase